MRGSSTRDYPHLRRYSGVIPGHAPVRARATTSRVKRGDANRTGTGRFAPGRTPWPPARRAPRWSAAGPPIPRTSPPRSQSAPFPVRADHGGPSGRPRPHRRQHGHHGAGDRRGGNRLLGGGVNADNSTHPLQQRVQLRGSYPRRCGQARGQRGRRPHHLDRNRPSRRATHQHGDPHLRPLRRLRSLAITVAPTSSGSFDTHRGSKEGIPS